MEELNQIEIDNVSGGIDVGDMFSAGFGASAGALFGDPPGAMIFGALGAGIGFITGLTAFALN